MPVAAVHSTWTAWRQPIVRVSHNVSATVLCGCYEHISPL